jgi:hypothetical protein
MLLRNRALLSIAATSRLVGVSNAAAINLTKSRLSFSSSFSTNAAEVFESENPAKNVMDKAPKKDLQSAILKENSIQEQEATHQQVQQLSEQMEDTFNKEKQILEDNKMKGATAHEIWETNKINVSPTTNPVTSEDVLKDLTEQQEPSMLNKVKDVAMNLGSDIKDAAKGTMEDAKEKLTETLNTPSSDTEKVSSGRRGKKIQESSKDLGSSDSDKPRSKQYSENKQNASIL